MGFFRSTKVASLLIVALATISSARAGELFTVTTSFSGDGAVFSAGELSAYIEACANTGATDFHALDTNLQQQCVSKLISPTATCSIGAGNEVVCNVGGVLINTKDITFSCGVGGCPFSDASLSGSLPSVGDCAAAGAVAGFTGTSCYGSAFCLYKGEASSFSHFGSYCPSSTGDFCCSATAAIDVAALPNGVIATGQDAGSEYIREIDHLVDMDIQVRYDVQRPAKLKISVEVPYVKSDTVYTQEENGLTVNYASCPTSYMIDFTPPIESIPRDPSARSPWLPLKYFPYEDQVGQYRSSCSNTDFGSIATEQEFITKFAKFHDEDTTSLTYGKVPAVNTTVWDSAVADGIPHGTDTFWRMETPVGNRVTYSTSKASDGSYYDLVRAFSKCERYRDGQRLVTKDNSGVQIINGVSFPMVEYRWELTVCQVGLFGRNCRDSSKYPQTYAKTCKKVPATFSVNSEQISSVSAISAADDLVSKTFLQEVTSTPGGCSTGQERYVITLNLIMMSVGYSITNEEVHDLIEPVNIMTSQTNIEMVSMSTYETTAEFLAGEEGNGKTLSDGVYFLKKISNNVGGVEVYSHKVVIVTQCYSTGYNAATGVRTTPDAFSTAVKDAQNNVRIDLEVVVNRDGGAVKNTLNLRILANSDSFKLPSRRTLTREQVGATQHLYGSYEVAKADQATPFANELALQGSINMFGGDQVCSKHQAGDNSLATYDSTVSILTPQFVSACLLTSVGSTHPLKGQTIQYKTDAMSAPAKFTFGCIETWIDTSTATLTDGVYVFSGSSVPRYPSLDTTHKKSHTFVIAGALNEALLSTGETHAERFGSGLMYYNATAGRSEVFKSDEMQISKAVRDAQALDPEHMTPGCQNRAGNLKSACNLVCFDLVDGILTDFQQDSTVLVHHVSVATIATEEQATDEKKFTSGARKSRRMLLESVSTIPSGLERALASEEGSRDSSGDKTGAAVITVTSRSSDDDDDDDRNTLPIALGVSGGIIFIVAIIACCWYGMKRNKKNKEEPSLSRTGKSL